MRGHGLTSFHLKRQLRDWIELSTTKSVPIFILIMSRAFSLHQEHVPEVANVGNLLKPEVPTSTPSKTETSAKEAQVEDRLGSQPGVPSTETEPVKPAKPSKSSPKVIDSEDVDVIRESLLSLDPVIVKEVALAAANASENLTPEITQLKLDSLTFQKEVSEI